jgi:hypothetical protein
MPAANTDKVLKVGVPGTATTLAAPGHNIAGAAINVVSTTNWPTDTGVAFAMDQVEIVNGEEQRIPGTYTEWVGVVDSPTSIASMVLAYGTDQVYPAGSLTRVYIPVSSTQVNRFAEAFLTQHKQNGTHGAITADSVTAPVGTFTSLVIGGTPAAEGWNPITGVPAVATGFNKGQKEQELTWAGVDLTGILYPGYKIKIPRTVTPPTQCADFESSSTQYGSDSSVSGITFTDDFTVEGWYKFESYPSSAGTLLSRWNGTSGWDLRVNSSGQLSLSGFNGSSANESYTVAQQSVPLGVWVHIAVCLDMSTFTAAGSPIYINGVSVPVSVGRAGTNPTALVQAGNLELGSRNGGTLTFDGMMSDIRLWSVVRTATQVRDNMNHQLVGSETNLIGYWKLNGNLNDSTANANNFAASGGLVATTVDNPMNATEYGFITKVAKPASDTIVTVFTGTDHNIPLQTLGAASYSQVRSPQGFPSSRAKWRTYAIFMAQYTKSVGSATTYYVTPLKLTLGTGAWNLGYDATARFGGTSPGGAVNGQMVLTEQTSDFAATAFDTTEAKLSTIAYFYTNTSSIQIATTLRASKYVEKSAQALYSLAAMVAEAAGAYLFEFHGYSSFRAQTEIYAECAYV